MVDVKMWRRRRQPNHSDGRRAECPATAPRRGTQKRAPGGPETNLETEQEEQNMKKRLLSAALALAMVLTMLPLSVFATPAPATATGSGTEAASYQAKNNANNEYAGAPGWFAQLKGTDGKVTGYEKITKGFIVNGKYYSTFPLNTANAPLSTTFTVVGADNEADMQNATSVNVDVYGEGSSVTIKGGKLTSITVNDSKYQSEVAAGQRSADELGSVTLNALTRVGDRGVTLNLTNVKSTSAVTLKGKNSTNGTPLANTITLTNATIGDVTMGADDCTNTAKNHVYASQRLTANASNVAKAPGNGIGNITMVGSSGSQINLTDTALGSSTINLTGVGTSLIANGATTGTGKVTLIGSVDEKVTTGTAPSVTVNGHSLGAIEGDTTNKEKLTSNFTVTVNSAGTVSGIELKNANVTINGGKVSTTGAINVTTGSVKIQNGATVGNITFGKDGIISEFSVTGSRNTVGAVSVTDSNTFKTVNIVADSTNKFTSLNLGDYAGHGVHGGTYTTAIDKDKEKAYLDTSLAYRVKLADNSIRYFPGTADGLSQAIAAAGKTNAESGEGIILVGQSNTKKITFQNGTTVLAKIGFSAPSSIIAPSVINGITYSNWTLTSNTNQTGTPIAGGQEFTRTEVEDITLDGQGVTGSVTKITNAVSAAGNNQDVTVKLVGNTVTLSGVAQPDAGDLAVFQVKLITDIVSSTNGSPVEVTVGVSWNSRTGKTTFANDVALGYGITVSADGGTLTLKNGVKYTVNGSGLKKLVTTFKTHEDSKEIKVSSVTAPGYTTNNQKNLLIKELLSDTAKNSTFTWNTNPEMRQAVNAAKATISESQVESWKTQAQRTAWSKTNSKTPTEADLASTGYTKVMLVPYLNVTITKANPLTVTMAPYYRVEVWHTSDNDGASANNPPIEVQAGRALTGLNSMISSATGKELKVKFAGSSAASATYAHQDGIYVYEMKTGEFTITHAGKSGLGTVVLNTTAPLVSMKRTGKEADGTAVTAPDGNKYYYDSLQAAVDDTLPQAEKKEDEISITSAYTGNGNINVAGQARIFKITTNGNTTITSNASGDVRVTAPASGSTYTIQLVKDVASATSTVSISVNTAIGGSASVSSSSAKPGDTVTVTPRAVSGYKVSGVTAVTNTGASVPVKANSNGTYTFTVPANATKVTVTPRFVASENRIFPDVDPKSWYGPSVKYCYETTVRGVRLMEGDANGNFAPNAKLTRAQMVQMLYNLAGRPTVTGACPFPDVVGTGYDWAAAPITWAAQKGYVIGYSDGKFHPEVNVSRQDMVLILYRYAKQPAIGASGSLSGYYDASSVGSWAYDAVRWAASMGILSGTNSVALNGYINGPVRANRCEVAVTLANFHRLYG